MLLIQYAYRVKDRKGSLQVRLGETAGKDVVEVLAGLTAGERVALDTVKAGMAVAGKQ